MIVLAAPTGQAQQAKAYKGEAVVTAEGKLASPWIERKACVEGTTTCKTMIVNPNTHEIAKLGDRWSTKFAPTGNGHEVQRAETEIAKTKRLQSS